MPSSKYSAVTEKTSQHGASGTSAPQSRLLALPRELRNLIYEHALTEPLGLSTAPNSSPIGLIQLCAFTTRQRILALDSNQLRYVCRQLHAETNALGLKYNTIYFQPEIYSTATVYDIFARFRNLSSARSLQSLRRIVLLDAFTCHYPGSVGKMIKRFFHDQDGIVNFARGYPNVIVVVRFRWANDLSVGRYISLANDLSELLRGTRPFSEPDVPDDPLLKGHADRHFDFGCPENLRFAPTLERDEHRMIHNAISKSQTLNPVRTLDQLRNDKSMQEMVAVVKRIHEEGI